MKRMHPLVLTALVLLTAATATAQVPRMVLTELGSATW